MPTAACTLRWTYWDLWEQSMEVARALHACAVAKGTRVVCGQPAGVPLGGIWHAASWRIAVTLSTFSAPADCNI